jgi:hypothetical protein
MSFATDETAFYCVEVIAERTLTHGNWWPRMSLQNAGAFVVDFFNHEHQQSMKRDSDSQRRLTDAGEPRHTRPPKI